jgi:outer membrane protein TolC
MGLLALLEATVGEPVRPIEGGATRLDVTPREERDTPWSRTYLIRSYEQALASQERFTFFDRVSWLPALVGQAKGSYNSNKAFAGTNWIFDGIISLQWTVFDQGQRSAEQKQHEAKTIEVRARLEGSRAKAQAGWIGARANLAAAEAALAQSEAQAALAARAQHAVETSAQAGFSTSLEVSTADAQRFMADSAVANARSQLEVRKVELAAAEGRLAELLGVSGR